jgi:hypothetical protein
MKEEGFVTYILKIYYYIYLSENYMEIPYKSYMIIPLIKKNFSVKFITEKTPYGLTLFISRLRITSDFIQS